MTEQVQVKIKVIVATQRYGTLETGDILRTDAEFARFLVEECSAADYVETSSAPIQPVAKKRKGK